MWYAAGILKKNGTAQAESYENGRVSVTAYSLHKMIDAHHQVIGAVRAFSTAQSHVYVVARLVVVYEIAHDVVPGREVVNAKVLHEWKYRCGVRLEQNDVFGAFGDDVRFHNQVSQVHFLVFVHTVFAG